MYVRCILPQFNKIKNLNTFEITQVCTKQTEHSPETNAHFEVIIRIYSLAL